MARLAATAVLLFCLLAVANCRVLEAEPDTAVAISDEQSQADPVAPQEADAAEVIPGSVPTVALGEGESILRLPSHRRPCRHGFIHRHLRWARHHGLSHRGGDLPGAEEARVLPEEPREAELEAVAEPDPDTRPDTDGEQMPFNSEEDEKLKAWKVEMLRRFRAHALRFHRGHHHEHAGEKDGNDDQQQKEEGTGGVAVKLFSRHFHHHHHGAEGQDQGAEEQEQHDKVEVAESMPVKLLTRHFHHRQGDEEQEDTTRKHYFHHHHDSDNEVDEIEELARRLSKAIMRRSLGRGGIRHHLHHHRVEEGGVKKWFRGLLNINMF